VLVEVGEIQSSTSLPWENTWDPRNRVPEIPHGDTHTSISLDTCSSSSVIGIFLECHVGIGHGFGDSDIELSECAFNTKGCVGFHDGDQCIDGWIAGGCKVGLHTDTVDRDAGRLERLHDVVDDGVGFWAGGFNVVVVVEEFGVGVCGVGCFECNLNCELKVRLNSSKSIKGLGEGRTVLRTEDLEESVISECSIFVESFVDDVPVVALTFPVCSFFSYVVDKCCGKSRFGPWYGGSINYEITSVWLRNR
jgi:hypothetical protein